MIEAPRRDLTAFPDDLRLLEENTDPYTSFTLHGTAIDGLYLFQRRLYPDERGSYQELGRTEVFEKHIGRPVTPKQWALSYNKPHVLRGLHAEPQDKVITPWSGVIFTAIADIRPDSKTFGNHVTFTFDQRDPEKAKSTLFVANGLANSFMTLGEENAEYFYVVTSTYQTSEGKRAVRWNDPDLNIQWPNDPTIISADDANKHPYLRQLFPHKFTNGR